MSDEITRGCLDAAEGSPRPSARRACGQAAVEIRVGFVVPWVAMSGSQG